MKLLKTSNFCLPCRTLGTNPIYRLQGWTKYCSASTVASRMLCSHRQQVFDLPFCKKQAPLFSSQPEVGGKFYEKDGHLNDTFPI